MTEQHVTKDLQNKTLTVERTFKAPRSRVWRAWTDSNELDKWWGPRQWPTKTKSFDFREGGSWHYYMTGPDGTESWGLLEYVSITPEEGFDAVDNFTDESGIKNEAMPHTKWQLAFEDNGGTTKMTSVSIFTNEADMQRIIDMGFEAGFTEQLDKFDEYLEADN